MEWVEEDVCNRHGSRNSIPNRANQIHIHLHFWGA